MKWTPFLQPVRTSCIIRYTVLSCQPHPASIKTDEDRLSRPGDRFSRRDDFASSRRVFRLRSVRIMPIYTFSQPIVRSFREKRSHCRPSPPLLHLSETSPSISLKTNWLVSSILTRFVIYFIETCNVQRTRRPSPSKLSKTAMTNPRVLATSNLQNWMP